MSLSQFKFFPASSTEASLPDELITEILFNLSLKDLFSIDLTCKKLDSLFKRSVNSDAIWQRLFKKHFYMDISGPHCMEKFILFYTCKKIFSRMPHKYSPQPEKWELARKLQQQLRAFAATKATPADEIWRSFLEAMSRLYFNEVEAIQRVRNQKEIVACDSLLQRSAELNNPFAMLRLAIRTGSPQEEETLLTRAHNLGCVEATYQLGMYYFRHANIAHVTLILEAAKAGSAKAAVRLVELYRNHPVHDFYVPFGEEDWALFDRAEIIAHSIFKEINQPMLSEYIPQLRLSALKGSPLAASLLMKIYRLPDFFNLDLCNHYGALAKSLFNTAQPARLERMRYWLEEAAKDPEEAEKADRELEKVKRELAAFAGQQPTPRM